MLKSSLLALALILPTLAFAQESDPSVPEVWNASILYLRDYAAEMSQLAPLVSQALEAPAPDCGPDVPEKDCAPHLTQAALPGTPLANAADGLPQVPAKIAEDAVRAAEAANKLTKMEPPTTMDEVKRILKETLGLSQETYRHLLPNLAEPLTYGAIATIGTIPFNESVGNHAAQHPWPSYIVKPAEIAGYGIPIAGTFAAAIFTHNAWARRFTEEALAFNLYAQSFSEGGNAVAYGMTWENALKAVTLWPAEIFGVADRVGSLAPGREANVVVWSGDPFEFTTRAEHVWIRGVERNEKTRQDLLTERYLTLPGKPIR